MTHIKTCKSEKDESNTQINFPFPFQALSTVSVDEFQEQANFYSLLFTIIGIVAAVSVFMQVLWMAGKRRGTREQGGESVKLLTVYLYRISCIEINGVM